jgi:hypothetical protein
MFSIWEKSLKTQCKKATTLQIIQGITNRKESFLKLKKDSLYRIFFVIFGILNRT